MIHNLFRGGGSDGYRKGFTLIEVLIVVAIIGILASVVLVGLGPLQRQGRDARRISDLKQVQAGLELYYNKCGYYPGILEAGVTCGVRTAIAVTFTDPATQRDSLGAILRGSAIGITNLPQDPSRAKMYAFSTNDAGTNYVLRAVLDDANNPALQDDLEGTINTIDCTDTATVGNYCVQL